MIKKGNIIVRERFLNGKLIEKKYYDIIYYKIIDNIPQTLIFKTNQI
jgi:hypothetical protein